MHFIFSSNPYPSLQKIEVSRSMLDRKMFNQLQKQGLKEMPKSDLSQCWWQEGPRYILQFHRASMGSATRVYVGSSKMLRKIPNTAYYEGQEYILDFRSVKEADFPLHFVPYVRFRKGGD